MVEVLLLTDEDVIRTFVDPLHQKMLQVLIRQGPQTSAGLARALGGKAANLHYHLKSLEAAGLVELDHEEVIRGIRARFLRPAARHYQVEGAASALSPGTLGSVGSAVRVIGNEYFEGWDRMLAAPQESGRPAHRAALVREDLLLTPEEEQELWTAWEAALGRAKEQDRAHRESGDSGAAAEWALLAGAYPRDRNSRS